MADRGDKGRTRLDPTVLKELWSGDERTVLRSLQGLRSAGSIYYIPELLRLLSRTASEPIEKELVRFLSDVKDRAAVPLILEGLRDRELEGARGNILSACWQSGLDFSGDLELFVQLFLEGDYRTALESFTVIEESVIKLGENEIVQARDLLLEGMQNVSEEKKPLARELVKLLEA